jgi:hypothetical protein
VAPCVVVFVASLELEVELGFVPVAVLALVPDKVAEELEEDVPFNLLALR